MQNTISEHTTHRTPNTGCRSCQLRTGNKGYNSHRLTKIGQQKIGKTSDESWFLLRHSDGRVRIWCKEHESMAPSCLVSTVQVGGGGVMVWGIFFLAHFWLLSTNWATPQPTWVLLLTMSIPLWLQCTHLLMATSSSIMHHVTKLKSYQTGFLYMTMSSLYSNGLHSHQISIQ